jgi:ABC-type spermidine/putrescine transport system permease subunit II
MLRSGIQACCSDAHQVDFCHPIVHRTDKIMCEAAAMVLLMSFENFNTTLMLVGSDTPLTVLMYGRMREGATPVLNAVSLFLMVASALVALMLLWRKSDKHEQH